MANITAADVNALRQKTGAGMMDCKKALVEANGDFENAIDILRKRGQALAAKRADREASEGIVITKISADKKTTILIALNCETDFVAKNNDFVSCAENIAKIAIENRPATIEELRKYSYDGREIEGHITDLTGKIAEKIELSAYEIINAEGVSTYIHHGSKLGVIIGLSKNSEKALEAGHDIAMQIAAMNPIAIDKDDVPSDTIAREIEIGKDQARQQGKPEEMVEKIALGKLNKFYAENTLLNQEYLKEGKISVRDYLNKVESGLTITNFKRVNLNA